MFETAKERVFWLRCGLDIKWIEKMYLYSQSMKIVNMKSYEYHIPWDSHDLMIKPL